MTEIYNNINSWKDKSSFACANSFFRSIAFNTTTDIVYHIHSEEDLSKTLPAATATTVHLNLNFQLKQAFLDRLLVTFTKSNKVLLSVHVELGIQTIEKFCKTAARKGINIMVVSSDQKKIIEDIMKRYEKKYKKQYREYEKNQGRTMKRLASEVELIEVPVDRLKRHIFFLKQSLKLATTIEFKQKEENHVEDLFKKVLRDGVKYEHVNGLKLDTQPMLVNGHNKILEQVRRFVNCIAKFDNHSILVTNFDLFWHNQPSHDDSAFGLDASDFYTTPVCKLKKKMTKNKGFKEISVYFGMIELLIVGGYVFTGGDLVPFLGSSLGNFEFQDESTCEILIPTTQQPYMNTERLLDQYFKHCSYKLWGYHCLNSYLKKFMPIIPVHFYGHASQKHKAFNIHHFASELLYVLCSKQAITKDMMAELWLSFTRTNFYETAVNGAYIVNFREMKDYLDVQEAKNVYVKLLVKVAVEMEAKCPNYPAVIFGLDNGRKNALDIMTDGLKEAIRKQNVANVMTRKKELRL
ncbi:hypothetical protein RO3G_14860 [Rhizopus delemar RA 99-880]|uniref:Uncharacterized protein n=4 Tax=Rhizopus TaxID=4842 RepID=I1CNW9_RHIO9|nr:hypothetical protein RO3G_14860 [Rhizopus delemar RA 99-880]|eukprot:EIE90149.1 hypothetical protein RO3G_14860 [Rhizopus delemar RA 99-880]